MRTSPEIDIRRHSVAGIREESIGRGYRQPKAVQRVIEQLKTKGDVDGTPARTGVEVFNHTASYDSAMPLIRRLRKDWPLTF